MKAFIISIILIIVCCVSCKSKTVEEAILETKLTNEQKIEQLLSPSVEIDLGLNEAGKDLMLKFYQSRNFKPLWIEKNQLTEKGKTLAHFLKNPILFGLSNKRLGDLKWSKEYALENEIIISYLLAKIYPDLKYGIIDSSQTQLKSIQFAPLETLDTLYKFSSNPKEMAGKIIAWGPKDTTYQMLAQGLFQFAATRDLSVKKIKMPLEKEDSIKAFEIAKQILVQKKYLTENDSTSDLVKIVKKFQNDTGNKPDGIIGQGTVDALTETDLEKCQRAALAMEKWRWKSEFPKRYIWVNIPEYTLRFFDNDTLRSINKIIVGKFKNQTPEFSAKLNSIVVYPFWGVPYSITSKEMLPEAKKNPNYFERNHLRLFKKEEEVNPYDVNWKKVKDETFPYKVIQDPGPHNSLGIIKLEFSNNYSVYIHDTPSKSLFNTIERSYSHGCVRCEGVVDLAKLILKADENVQVPDSLDTLLAREMNFSIRLKKWIPIYLDYFTVVPQKSNQLLFLKDIYKRDEKYLKIIFS